MNRTRAGTHLWMFSYPSLTDASRRPALIHNISTDKMMSSGAKASVPLLNVAKGSRRHRLLFFPFSYTRYINAVDLRATVWARDANLVELVAVYRGSK